MNQLRTAEPKISLRKTLLTLAASLFIWNSGAAAQEKLGDLVAEAGLDWMIGRWVAATNEGQEIQTIYKWELDKNLVSMSLKMGEFEGRGMIFYSASEGNVVQVGVDNRGGSNKGIWYAEGDKAIARLEFTQASGETGKMAIVHSKVDTKTMKVAMYAVDENGELAEEPWATLEYKRQRRQAKKKAPAKTQ
ncbi:MAG: hypothetical protein ACYTFW_23245 [Planctomycetota bacterium]|jgi:hypothetical protein